ncbi:thiamine-phosphate kinase [Cognatazoarcus halotolerans]|uniref:thiamine-phosphate kinase n=1 Tax=Cognatazoarcus halotolerans TaxID=2686016 RepID=UPI001357EC39|nr:thiamine-phosphate kinase [Cognatazoarcus halotolerans]MBX3680444.1 thiamine-phosphate kinase [Rhodocyclaceae bacterium]MCB1900000.1 thiamine-phosphate kinase [Rhodocyclaceae bacterium]MCP5310635.1 thiamine-phosphate kinase [Zoogloeaceae bacterium]
MPSEFDLISRHFSRATGHTDLAGGDDGALLTASAGMQLVVSTDMLVAGTHFFSDCDPESLGWKTLAVNVSDIAAMGATPRWATLALSLPVADEAWLTAFARGFYDCATTFDIDLIGGDTTRGPLNLCPTIFGEVPSGCAVTRDGARPGHDLWISGQPGRAALALAALRGELELGPAYRDEFMLALHRPQPRVALGKALRGLASAMLDVSDGVLGDLGHIIERSQVGCVLDTDSIPIAALTAACPDPQRTMQALLHGGDDYELLFTAAAAHREQILAISHTLALPLHRIGRIDDQRGHLRTQAANGTEKPLPACGFDHFN